MVADLDDEPQVYETASKAGGREMLVWMREARTALLAVRGCRRSSRMVLLASGSGVCVYTGVVEETCSGDLGV